MGGSPYRADKPLDQIILPDRRRERTIALVVASMILGVCLWQLAGFAVEALSSRGTSAPAAPPTPRWVPGRITASVLEGPGGPRRVPLPGVHVVHVWLQGCQDCMPAFEAMRDLDDRGGLGVHVPVLNVAYGEADKAWADRYGVGSDLLFDRGGVSVVKPLGISSFTTLVIDGRGNVIHRDRPDRPGYRDRVRAAVGEKPELAFPSPPPSPLADPLPDPFGNAPPNDTGLTTDDIVRVVTARRPAVTKACWDDAAAARATGTATVKITTTIGAGGKVTSTTSTGDDARVMKCVEGQVRTWVFPASRTAVTVAIPFAFRKE